MIIADSKKILSFLVALTILMSAQIFYTREVRASSNYSWGSYGETVKLIQNRLSAHGYYSGPEDGIFGYRTYEAILYFQKTNGLKQDGIAGEKTLAALGIFPREEAASDVVSGGISSKENDIWLLAKVINGESRGESYLGQVAVGAVVMNRVRHPGFPDTIGGVIYQAGAFDAVQDGQFDLMPAESCLNAARDAYAGFDPVDGAVFFWNPKTSVNKWVQGLTVTKVIGGHAFALIWEGVSE